jgi:heptosyltransferase-1
MVLHRIRAALTVAILPLKQGVLCPYRDVKRILLIKTSSLGDVVHNLPVVSDICYQFPDAVIDWAVEEAYVPLVALHPDVHQVIPVAVRRWRRQVWCASTWREIASFRQCVTAQTYDAVIDTQGLFKSALLGCMAAGTRHGFDAGSVREPLAGIGYQKRHAVTRTAHAVIRNRLLAGAALGYVPHPTVNYGLGTPPVAAVTDAAVQTAEPERYAVLLHASSRDDKLWPEDNWVELAAALSAQQPGLRMLLPFGNALEQQRSLRLVQQMHGKKDVVASAPAAMALDGMARLLAGAACVIGVDTGLTHLATALGRPTVALFMGSDPMLTGVYGSTCACNLGSPGRAPTVMQVLDSLGDMRSAAQRTGLLAQ